MEKQDKTKQLAIKIWWIIAIIGGIIILILGGLFLIGMGLGLMELI